MLPLLLGGLGAVGGGLGGAALAGKYMPKLGPKAYEAADLLRSKASSGLRGAAKLVPGTDLVGGGIGGFGRQARDIQRGLEQASQNVANIPLGAVEGAVNLAVPATVGLGGAALGGGTLQGIGQAFMPPEQAIDPETYGSSNSPGARYKAPTMQYV